jgi:flavin reductase (DIM6/NTAB) family NADH-FMN oxidoreductase RutF
MAYIGAMEIDPLRLTPADRYKLLVGLIVPRPIAFVSTRSRAGATNLAPFSFFCGVASEPMSLIFCPANKGDGSHKDTLANILATSTRGDGVGGQFVVNIVPHALGAPMAACAEDLPHGESEFVMAGLTEAPSKRVTPPRVAECPACFECEATHVIQLAPGAAGGGNIVVGRVVWTHASDDVMDARYHADPARLDALGRMAGLTYCTTRERMDIPWGRRALG